MLDAGEEDKRDSVLVLLELIMVREETDATQVHMQERLAEEKTAGEVCWERNKLGRLAKQTGKVSKRWREPKHSSTGERRKDVTHSYSGILPSCKDMKCMTEPQNFMLRERSQMRVTQCTVLFI